MESVKSLTQAPPGDAIIPERAAAHHKNHRKFGSSGPGTAFITWAGTICFYEAKKNLRLAARSPLHFAEFSGCFADDVRLVLRSHAPQQTAALPARAR